MANTMSALAGWRSFRPAAARVGRFQRATLIAGVALIALVLAYLLVRRSAVVAFALVLLPPMVWLITRPGTALSVGLVLILVLPYWQTLGTPQANVTRLASLAAAATVLFKRGLLRPCATDYALALFVAVSVLGWLLQYNEPHAGRIVATELTPVGFYIGARAIPKHRLQNVMTVALWAGTLGALTVVYEYLLGHPVFQTPVAYRWQATDITIFRPGGIFGSPPGASTVLCIVILLGVGSLSRLSGRARSMAYACLGICTIGLILTFTRAALIAVGVAVIFFLWSSRTRWLRVEYVAWFASALAVILLVAFPILQRNTVFQKGIARAGTLTARESYWSAALPVATASPHNLVFGVGTAALEAPALSPDAPLPLALASTPQIVLVSLHNQYMTNLVEQGIIGVASLLVLLAIPLARVTRAARATGDARYAVLGASIVAVAIVMTVDTALLHSPSFAMIMLVLGLAAAATVRPAAVDACTGGPTS